MQKKSLVLYIFLISIIVFIPFNSIIGSAENSTFTINLMQEEPMIKDGKYVIVAGIWHDITIDSDMAGYENILLKLFKAYDELVEKNETNYYQWEFHKTGLELWHLIPLFYFLTGLFLPLALFVNLWSGIGLVVYFGTYILVIKIVSVIQAIKYKKWSFLFMLPFMFIEGHLFWSIGLLQEIFSTKKMSD